MEIISKSINIKEQKFVRYEIKNSSRIFITLDSLGASIRDIKILNKDNEYITITLAPVDDEIFYSKYNYHGKTIGRSSGRIKNAQYTLNNTVATLEKNNFANDNLHGGSSCYGFKLFNSDLSIKNDYLDVIFTYKSNHLEGGYLEDIDVKITYRIYEKEDKIKIIFEGESTSTSYMNLTNHVYLNLNGNLFSTIEDSTLYINASKVGKLNKNLIIDEIIDTNENFSFQNPHKIKDYLYEKEVQENTLGYDHPYFLNTTSINDLACFLKSDTSNLRLNIYTTYPVIVLYTNNYPTQYEVYKNKLDRIYYSCCLETQFNPNGINSESKRNGIFDKNYKEETIYEFFFEE